MGIFIYVIFIYIKYIFRSIYYYGFFIDRESIADKFCTYKLLIISSLSKSYLLAR